MWLSNITFALRLTFLQSTANAAHEVGSRIDDSEDSLARIPLSREGIGFHRESIEANRLCARRSVSASTGFGSGCEQPNENCESCRWLPPP